MPGRLPTAACENPRGQTRPTPEEWPTEAYDPEPSRGKEGVADGKLKKVTATVCLKTPAYGRGHVAFGNWQRVAVTFFPSAF